MAIPCFRALLLSLIEEELRKVLRSSSIEERLHSSAIETLATHAGQRVKHYGRAEGLQEANDCVSGATSFESSQVEPHIIC